VRQLNVYTVMSGFQKEWY